MKKLTTRILRRVLIMGFLAFLLGGTFFAESNHYSFVKCVSPANPSTDTEIRMDFELLAEYHTDHNSISDFTVVMPLVYMIDYYDGLIIVNVSDPLHPTTVGTYAAGETSLYLKLFGTIAYIFDDLDGIYIVNVSDPSHPALIDTYSEASYFMGICAHDDVLFYSKYTDGLFALNISDLTHPTPLLSLPDLPEIGMAFQIQNNLLYMATFSNKFLVYNVSDVLSPSLIGEYTLDKTGYFMQIKLQEEMAILASWTNGLLVLNISDPTLPTFISSISNKSETSRIFLHNEFLFMADGKNGLQAVDIQDLTSPVIIGNYDIGGPVRTVAAFSKYIFLGNEVKGFQILEYTVHTIENQSSQSISLPGWPWGLFLGCLIGAVTVLTWNRAKTRQF